MIWKEMDVFTCPSLSCFMMSAVCKETKKWYGMGWYQAFLM